MWIISQLGYFSLARRPDGWHVRARARRDLGALREAAGIASPILRWPDADYRYRLVLDAEGLRRVMLALAESIDDQDLKEGPRGDLYATIWAVLTKISDK